MHSMTGHTQTIAVWFGLATKTTWVGLERELRQYETIDRCRLPAHLKQDQLQPTSGDSTAKK